MSSSNNIDALVTQVAKQLQSSPIYIDSSFKEIDGGEQAALVKTINSADVPIFVVAANLEQGNTFGSGDDLLVRVHDELGEPGIYITVEDSPYISTYRVVLKEWDAEGYDSLYLPFDTGDIATDLHPDDMGEGLVALTTAIATDNVDAQLAKAHVAGDKERVANGQEPMYTADGTQYSPDLGSNDSSVPVAGVLSAVVATAVVTAVALKTKGRRSLVDVSVSSHVSETLSDRVRVASDKRLVADVGLAVVELSEKIAGSTAKSTADNEGLWKQVLQYLDSSTRWLQAAESARATYPTQPLSSKVFLDLVGAKAATYYANAMLDAIENARAYAHQALCVMDPLHGPAVKQTKVKFTSGATKVLVCDKCSGTLRSKNVPDTLDVVVDNKSMPYYETQISPWAFNGFGALQEQLVTHDN